MLVVEIGLGKGGLIEPGKLREALIDSGADGTLVPVDILEKIDARLVGAARIRSVLGDSQVADIYLVSLQIGPHALGAVRVIAGPEADEIILGRNVLNQLVITLNGLASTLEVSA
jgi:predicted aspartyl protease